MQSAMSQWLSPKSIDIPSVAALYYVSWLRVHAALTDKELQLNILRNLIKIQSGSSSLFYFDLIASALLCLREQTGNKSLASLSEAIWRSIALAKLPSLISQLEKEKLPLAQSLKEGQETNAIENALRRIKQYSYLYTAKEKDHW